MLLLSIAMPGLAEVVAWPTFLRVQPSRTARVVDEIARGKALSVQGCEAKWCRVDVDGTIGFIEQDSIAAVPPPTVFVLAPDPAACFTSQRAGYKDGQPLLICPRATPPAADHVTK